MAKKKAGGFEERLASLEEIVADLEAGELSLEDSLARYQEGVEHLRRCYEMLKEAEGKVKILVKDGEGNLVEKPFEPPEE